jgi:hypothetical protein
VPPPGPLPPHDPLLRAIHSPDINVDCFSRDSGLVYTGGSAAADRWRGPRFRFEAAALDMEGMETREAMTGAAVLGAARC